MSHRVVHVTAASRLHFGLIALGTSSARRFGGVGVMVEPPRTQLSVFAADEFSAAGTGADRASEFARLWQQDRGWPDPLQCRIVVHALPRMHTGLGTGTQLGLCVARGLNAFWQLGDPPPEQLAQSVRRGVRSAVGTHGFIRGGLVFDAGKAAEQSLGALVHRANLPADWRFVLICPPERPGLHGDVEHRAFARLPAVPEDVARELYREAADHMLPAAEAGEFDLFAESTFRFGHRAGMNFAAVQGGAYDGPRLTALVDCLREWGVRGAGQSSWGPTVFALCPDQLAAESLVLRLSAAPVARGAEIAIARPCNHGAIVEIPLQPK